MFFTNNPMRKLLIILLFTLLLLTACTTVKPQENITAQVVDTPAKPVTLNGIVIHTLEKPYLDSTCPDQKIESFILVKMNKIISGNMTLTESNNCTGQIRNCFGYYDLAGVNNNKCWSLECDVSTPSGIDNSGITTMEYKACDYIKIRNTPSIINESKELSWEILA